MSEAEDGAEWLREIAREEIDAASITPEHVRLGAKVLGTAGVGLTALQLGAVGRVAAQETGPGAGTIGTEGSPLDAVYADTIDRDRDVIKPEELSILTKRFGLDDSVPLGTSHARVTNDALEFSPDGASWVAGQAERYDGSAWNGAVVERFDGNSWRQIYPESAIPDSGSLHARYDFSQEDGSTPVTDQTGNGHDLSGSYSGVSASINGVQAGEFDGVDDLLQATFTAESQPNTIFIVFEQISDTGDNAAVFDGGSKLSHDLIEDVQDSNWDLHAGSRIGGQKTRSVGDVEVASGLFDGSNSVLRFDGDQDATGDVGSRDLDGITLGGHGDDSNHSNVKIGEVLVYPMDKSSIFSDVESYLIDKWGPV